MHTREADRSKHHYLLTTLTDVLEFYYVFREEKSLELKHLAS
jgi:hypothetical protein